MCLMGMSCGAGGFSIPVAEPNGEPLANNDRDLADRDSLAREAYFEEADDGELQIPPEVQ